MPTGADLVQSMAAVLGIRGEHYGSFDCPHRCNPELAPFCTDCSGSISAACTRINLGLPPCMGSFQLAQICHQRGHALPFSDAINTPGALLFQGINEGQGGVPGRDPGHVGMAVGDGQHTLEARGHTAGIGLFNARSLLWAWCGALPGLTTSSTPTPAPIPNLPAQAAGTLEDDLMTTIALPASNATPHGRFGIARALRSLNVVYLEDGGRLQGDVLIASATAGDRTRHYWAPPKANQVPGATIFDVMDLRPLGRHSILAIYTTPDGVPPLTYEIPIPTPA